MNLIAIASDKDGDDQRTSCQTQFYGYRHAGNGKGEGTEDQSEEDAHEDGGNVRRIQTALGVTHLIGHSLHSILRAYDHDLITHLQGKSGRSKEVHAMTSQTGDVHAVDTREVHRCKRLAIDLRVGDKDALGYQRLVLLLKVDVELRTDEGHDGLLISLGADHQHLVAYMEDGVAVGDADFTVVNET